MGKRPLEDFKFGAVLYFVGKAGIQQEFDAASGSKGAGISKDNFSI